MELTEGQIKALANKIAQEKNKAWEKELANYRATLKKDKKLIAKAKTIFKELKGLSKDSLEYVGGTFFTNRSITEEAILKNLIDISMSERTTRYPRVYTTNIVEYLHLASIDAKTIEELEKKMKIKLKY